MASRQEEKEARRRAREEAEAAERRAQARKKRITLGLGGMLAAAAIAAVVIALASGGGGGQERLGEVSQASANVTLPEQQTTDLDEAVEAAGCELTHAQNEGSQHETREFTPADYQTNPPNSGVHTPEVAADGVYEPGNPPALGPSVHALEHGRINVQYQPGAPERTVQQLEAFVAENGGYHMLLFENQTDMDAEVAATAWTQVLTCPELNDQTFDALRTFRDRYIDKGPEAVP